MNDWFNVGTAAQSLGRTHYNSKTEMYDLMRGRFYTQIGDTIVIPKRGITKGELAKALNGVQVCETEDVYIVRRVSAQALKNAKIIKDGRWLGVNEICGCCEHKLKKALGECPNELADCVKAIEPLREHPLGWRRIKPLHCADDLSSDWVAKLDLSITAIDRRRAELKARQRDIILAGKLTSELCSDCVKHTPTCHVTWTEVTEVQVTPCRITEDCAREVILTKIEREFGFLQQFLDMLCYCGHVERLRWSNGSKYRTMVGFPRDKDTFKVARDYYPYYPKGCSNPAVSYADIKDAFPAIDPAAYWSRCSKDDQKRLGAVAYALCHSGGSVRGYSNWYLGINVRYNAVHTISATAHNRYDYPNARTVGEVYELMGSVDI